MTYKKLAMDNPLLSWSKTQREYYYHHYKHGNEKSTPKWVPILYSEFPGNPNLVNNLLKSIFLSF